jgi:zinc transport system substrate-binding protein
LPIAGCARGSGGAASQGAASGSAGKITIIGSIFCPYDFARQIAGNAANVEMLVPPGVETHSYEPTPQDIVKLQSANVFIYVGGDSDSWLTKMMTSIDTSHMTVLKLVDMVPTVAEKTLDGMQADPDDASADSGSSSAGASAAHGATQGEQDEHVWTAPKNAIEIVGKIATALEQADPANAATYQANAAAYTKQLQALDASFHQVVDHAKRKEIIVGDRFPFRYLADELGLTCYAAFPGCSTQTEANPQTIAFLENKVKADKIPVVFYIELSTHKLCDTICEATGAQEMELNSMHNVSAVDFAAGATYLSIQEQNVKNLQVALN